MAKYVVHPSVITGIDTRSVYAPFILQHSPSVLQIGACAARWLACMCPVRLDSGQFSPFAIEKYTIEVYTRTCDDFCMRAKCGHLDTV